MCALPLFASVFVPVFVLVSDGYDQELARHLEQHQGFLLSRPIQDADLDRILAQAAPAG